MAAAATPNNETHTLAEFIGHPGTTRILTKEDQNGLVGGLKIAKEDLVWPARSHAKLDVTEVHEAVLEYLNEDPEFKITTVEVPATS